MMTTEPTIGENTELSKGRNREAADRTLMAWIRTSLSLIGFGFAIYGITRGLTNTAMVSAPDLLINARVLGLSFIILALFVMFIALAQYRQELRMLETGDYTYKPSFPLAVAVAAALSLVGLFAGVSIVIEALAN